MGRTGLLAPGQLPRASRLSSHRTAARLPPGRTGHRQALGHAVPPAQGGRRVRPEDGDAGPADARTGPRHGQQDGHEKRPGGPVLRQCRNPWHRRPGPQRRGQGQGGEGRHRGGPGAVTLAGDRRRSEFRHRLGEHAEDDGHDPRDQTGRTQAPRLGVRRLDGAERPWRQEHPVHLQRPRPQRRGRFQEAPHRTLRPQAHQPLQPSAQDGPGPGHRGRQPRDRT